MVNKLEIIAIQIVSGITSHINSHLRPACKGVRLAGRSADDNINGRAGSQRLKPGNQRLHCVLTDGFLNNTVCHIYWYLTPEFRTICTFVFIAKVVLIYVKPIMLF